MEEQDAAREVRAAEVEAEQVQVDEEKLERFVEQLKFEENFPAGLLAGLLGAAVGAAIWALVTVATKFQIGWMAIGVGFLVGYAVRIFGKGLTRRFGFAGGALALLGCVAGNLAAGYAIGASQVGLSFADVMPLVRPDIAWDVFTATFSGIDLLFYGIAVYEGYRFAFRPVSQTEIEAALRA